MNMKNLKCIGQPNRKIGVRKAEHENAVEKNTF